MLITIMICSFLKSLRCIPCTAVYSTVILFSYLHHRRIVQLGRNKTKVSFNTTVFFSIPIFIVS